MTRQRQNFLSGVLSSALAPGDVLMSSTRLADLDIVASPNIAVIVLDPLAIHGDPEIVHVTTHGAGAATATILRAQENTVARAHPLGTVWKHAPTEDDFDFVAFPEMTEAQMTALEGVAPAGSAARQSDGTREDWVFTATSRAELVYGMRPERFGADPSGVTDSSDAFEDMFADLPALDRLWGPGSSNWETSGVPAIELSPRGVYTLTRPILIPNDKTFTMFCKAMWGARIQYDGAVVRTDGAITSGTTTLTCAGASFVAGDVGSPITVKGAEFGGATLVTYISAVNSPTEVVVGRQANATVSGARVAYNFDAFRRIGALGSGVGNPRVFRNIVFDGGGIYQGAPDRPTRVETCNFVGVPGPALLTLAIQNSSVSMDSWGNQFVQCYSGVYWEQFTASLCKSYGDRWINSHDTPCVLDGAHFLFDSPHFQSIDSAVSTTLPFVQIKSRRDSPATIAFRKARFASDQSTAGGNFHVPREAVVLGEIDTVQTVQGAAAVPGTIDFDTCEFHSVTAADLSDTRGKHIITINKRPAGLRFRASTVLPYHKALINEAWKSAGSGSTLDEVREENWWEPSNNVDSSHRGGIFTDGGIGWAPKPVPGGFSFDSKDPRRRTNNLLKHSNDFSVGSWNKLRVSVAQDVVGPDGVANSGWTVTRTDTSTARLTLASVTGFTVGRPVVFSVWLKKGTHDVAAFAVTATIGANTQELVDFRRVVKLTDNWERYYVVSAPIPVGTTALSVRVYNDVNATTVGAVNDTILAAYLQLEVGAEPTPYQHVPGANAVGEVPFGALVAGGRIIGKLAKAAAIPTQRHEVGDIYLYSDGITAGRLGKYCTVAGTPGTFVEFGNIGPTGAAYTQTFATADRTHAARTAVALTDNSGGTASDTIPDVPAAYNEATFANIVASLVRAINRNRADALDTAELANAVVDDLQGQGQVG